VRRCTQSAGGHRSERPRDASCHGSAGCDARALTPIVTQQHVWDVSAMCPAACPVSGARTLQWSSARAVERKNISEFSVLCRHLRLAQPMQLHLHMKIAELKRLSETPSVRGTEKQDTAIAAANQPWHKPRWVRVSGAAGIVLVALASWLIHAWSNSSHVIAGERLRVVAVLNGRFVRDVAAQGTVIAAVNPTMFAVAPGTVSYLVRAGDVVTKGQVLATLESPELNNEYQREHATLDKPQRGTGTPGDRDPSAVADQQAASGSRAGEHHCGGEGAQTRSVGLGPKSDERTGLSAVNRRCLYSEAQF